MWAALLHQAACQPDSLEELLHAAVQLARRGRVPDGGQGGEARERLAHALARLGEEEGEVGRRREEALRAMQPPSDGVTAEQRLRVAMLQVRLPLIRLQYKIE